MLARSQFNQRVRQLWAVMVRLQQVLGDWLVQAAWYELVDCNEYGVDVITPPPMNTDEAWSRADKRWLGHHRQIVETVLARLCEVFGLKRLNAHTDWGKVTRLAAKMAAYNMGILFNRWLGRPAGALATLIH